MKLPRRRFLHLATGAVALPALPRSASALDYPTRPVRLISGYAAGGVTDIIARLTGQILSDRLGQPFIIEDRPGGSSNLATEEVVRARPDGYTLLATTSSNAWNATLYQKLNFDFGKDISPVASTVRSYNIMVVSPSFPAKTVSEFIAHAKENPGQINVASVGVGSSPHLYAELFKRMAALDLVIVYYRDGPAAVTDLVSGRVQVEFQPVVSSIAHIKAGRLRALAVTSAKRSELLPDLPTIAEFVPGYEGSGWLGVGAPKDTPVEIIKKLNNEINAGLAAPNFKARLADLGVEPFVSSPTEFGKFVDEYTEKWAKVIKAANIKPE